MTTERWAEYVANSDNPKKAFERVPIVIQADVRKILEKLSEQMAAGTLPMTMTNTIYKTKEQA